MVKKFNVYEIKRSINECLDFGYDITEIRINEKLFEAIMKRKKNKNDTELFCCPMIPCGTTETFELMINGE
ncbi:hypothetical protein ACQKNX_08040 [Lysinibacillus sp. NPDC093712]|uniref:hypothetical protein n=1 Tax=Lysinibacillus sp. NPDC093712 TaxID=3390579 RepID=UPI003CFD5AD3